MNKLRIATICIICVSAALASSFLTAASLNHSQSGGFADSHSSDFPTVQAATKNSGYYNVTLAFTNVTDPERLDNILINPQSSKTVTDATFYSTAQLLTSRNQYAAAWKTVTASKSTLHCPAVNFLQAQKLRCKLWVTTLAAVNQ